MLESPAKIISSVVIGLGTPESIILQESEAANVVFRKLALYYEAVRQSDQGLLQEVTSEFTLASGSTTQDITALTSSDAIIPLWCERKIFSGGSTDTWEFVPTVNLDTIPENRIKGRVAVGFYGATPLQITAEFSFSGDETSPFSTYRVWYAPSNPITGNKDQALAIPETLAPLVVVDSQLSLIPLMIVNASKYLDKQPQLAPRIAAWQGMMENLQVEKAEWLMKFEIWSRRSRGSHRAINFNEVLDDIFHY